MLGEAAGMSSTQQSQASGKVEESGEEQAAYDGKDEVQTRVLAPVLPVPSPEHEHRSDCTARQGRNRDDDSPDVHRIA